MSYDLRFAVKGIDEKMYVVFEPELHSPTYNLGTLFRKSMQWDFKQSEWYLVKDIIPNIKHGLRELQHNSEAYRKYEPDNGYGSIDGAIQCYRCLLDCINDHINGWDWNDYDLSNLYISW